MPMAAEPVSPTDRAPPVNMTPMTTAMVPDAIPKDAIIAWFRGEFAAANAIIDTLCDHLAQLSDGGSEYDNVFVAIHRRRLNWIPVLQMQKYHSIADVMVELGKLGARKKVSMETREVLDRENEKKEKEVNFTKVSFDEERFIGEEVEIEQKVVEGTEIGDVGDEIVVHDEVSPDCEVTDSGSQAAQPPSVDIDIFTNHEDCEARRAQIKLTKGFSAKEPVKGHMVNVVKGLKIYEDIFTDSELSTLTDFVNELRLAGEKGELSGETFILFNQQVKGKRRELIQFGVPLYGHIKEEAASDSQTSNIEPIPSLLQRVIDRLVQWQLLPEYKKPNGCIINFFEEEEYSQPFQKPPHLEQPISTLFLAESTMAFGRTIVSDNEGNYKGPLMLSLKEGSLIVLRGNSADMARHVMCPSPNRRISITFFRVRSDSNHFQSSSTPQVSNSVTLWQPGNPSPYTLPNGLIYGHEATDVMPQWEVFRAPVVMLAAPMCPMVLSPRKLPPGGTGVFLPWSVGSRKLVKHLPPRAQKGRFLALPSSVETHVADSTSEPAASV